MLNGACLRGRVKGGVASSHACVFVLPKHQTRESNASHRVISCVWFCNSLQTFYKYKSLITQPTESIASHRSVVISRVCFLYSLQTFTNTKASSLNQPRATHRIASLSSHACVFVNPSCKCFTKYKASNSREQRDASCHLNEMRV